MRQAGAMMMIDPKAEAKWRQVLEQRQRNRERAELDAMFRAQIGKDKWS
jgi:hypothetical protein